MDNRLVAPLSLNSAARAQSPVGRQSGRALCTSCSPLRRARPVQAAWKLTTQARLALHKGLVRI